MEKISFICTLFNHDLEIVQRMVDSVNQIMMYCPLFKYNFVFVDNSDTKGNYKNLVNHNISDFIDVWVDSSFNLGYCGGNNLGIKHTDIESEYIIIINPDIIIENSLCIDWMVGSSKLNNSITGWMIGTNEWYTYASTFPTESKYDPALLPFYSNEPTFDKPGRWKAFRYIDGSFMCFPRQLAVDINGFDEDIFPGYFGENTFCFKAFLAGYKIENVHTRFHYVHKHGQRTALQETQIHHWSKIGRQLFYEKYALPNWDKFIQYLNL